MKSLKALLLLAAMATSFAAYAAMLTSEVTQGMYKICIYSDGSAITVPAANLCPLSN